MSIPNARLSRKTNPSEHAMGKVKPRLSEEPPILPPVHQELDNTIGGYPASQIPTPVRLLKTRVPEALAASPYATSQDHHRSISAAKGKIKSAGGTKQITPVRDRPSPLLSNVKSETIFTKLKLPHPTMQGVTQVPLRRKPNKEVLNASTMPKDLQGTDQSSHMNLSFNSSFNNSLALQPTDSPHRQSIKNPLRPIDVKMVEINFSKAVKELAMSRDDDLNREMQVYSQTFTDLIELNAPSKPLLSKIKSKYESWIQTLSERSGKETSKYQSEIISLQNSLLREIEEKKALTRKFEKVSKENIELSHSCESFRNQCFEYQEKLFEISNTKMDDFPPTEAAWKVLISELAAYKNWKSKVVKELKLSQAKEKKLLELVHAMKKRGYPVEEVYNTDVRGTGAESRKKSSARSEDSEVGSIVTGPPKLLPKPDSVPNLRLEDVEREVSSESESEVSVSEYEASLRKTMMMSGLSSKVRSAGSEKGSVKSLNSTVQGKAKMGKTVPQLSIPDAIDKEQSGFHQEFMAKYEEFSESWRKQIDAQKH